MNTSLVVTRRNTWPRGTRRSLLLPLRLAMPAVLLAALASPAHAGWIQTAQSGSVGFFLLDTPPRIERYDMARRASLAPIPLEAAATALAADDAFLYVAFDRSLSRIRLDGTAATPLAEASSPVREIVAGPIALFLIHDDRTIESIDKRTGSAIAQRWYPDVLTGVSLSTTAGRLFGQAVDVSPADIHAISAGEDGSLGPSFDTPHHGSLPEATRTWVLQDGTRVANDAGVVYTASGLVYSNSFGGAVDDLAMYGDATILLRGAELYLLDGGLRETGRHFMDRSARRILVHGDAIFAFDEEPPGALHVAVIPVGLLEPARPGPPVDPHDRAYRPRDVVLDASGVVYLLSGENRSIFRWSIPANDYLETIPLVDSGMHMAYAEASRRLYVSSFFPSTIWAIELDAGPSQVPLVNLPIWALGLATAGDIVFAAHASGLSGTAHFTFTSAGSPISRKENLATSRIYTWSAATRRIYAFRDSLIPNDLAWDLIGENGAIVSSGDSPYHGGVRIQSPIRVAPDGSALILGSGELYDPTSLIRISALPNGIADAAWLDGELFTIRDAPPYTEIQRWSAVPSLEHSFLVPGAPVRLLPYEGQLLVVTRVDGVPRFFLKRGDADDLDEDGIPDRRDNCPGTPNQGQEDSDLDGTGDLCDNCDRVPSQDQTDSDRDGVGNACDACPGSRLAETVVVAGCDSGVAESVLGTGCSISDLAARCETQSAGHGPFVSCVAALVNELSAAGVIDRGDKGRIQRCAASEAR